MDLGSHEALSYALRNSRIWEKKSDDIATLLFITNKNQVKVRRPGSSHGQCQGPLTPWIYSSASPSGLPLISRCNIKQNPQQKDPSLRGKQYKTNSAGGDINWYVLHGGQYRGIYGYYEYYKRLPTRPHLSVLQTHESVQPAISVLGVCLRYTRHMGNMMYTQDIPQQHYGVSTRLETIKYVPGWHNIGTHI